jgi:hypothetical protein
VNLSKGEEYVGTVYAAITVLTTLANLQGVRNTEIPSGSTPLMSARTERA